MVGSDVSVDPFALCGCAGAVRWFRRLCREIAANIAGAGSGCRDRAQ